MNAPAPRVERAAEIVAEIRDLLADAGPDFEHVYVGTDARQAAKAGSDGAVIVSPPVLEFPTYGTTAAEWDVHVISGPIDNWLAAWDRIDQILEALRLAGLAMGRAEPAGFALGAADDAPTIPAYSITLAD